jgi:peptidoglycan biosynthesis protein MviN/MurJ (putative lipid II flippase)
VEERREEGRRLARSTAIFSLATGLSRILGLVREMVAANYFGAAGRINAFTIAFQVPNLALNALLDALFYRFGTWGIPLATTLVNVAGSVLLLVLLRRRIGRIDLG